MIAKIDLNELNDEQRLAVITQGQSCSCACRSRFGKDKSAYI